MLSVTRVEIDFMPCLFIDDNNKTCYINISIKEMFSVLVNNNYF